MTGTYALARRPEDIVPALLAHLNSLDTEVMLNFYDPEGMLVDAQGVPQVGREAIRAELRKYFSLGLPMKITARHIFVAGDIASLVLDWSYTGTGACGTATRRTTRCGSPTRRSRRSRAPRRRRVLALPDRQSLRHGAAHGSVRCRRVPRRIRAGAASSRATARPTAASGTRCPAPASIAGRPARRAPRTRASCASTTPWTRRAPRDAGRAGAAGAAAEPESLIFCPG